MRREDRIDEVDLLRGIAAVLMILGHSFIVYPVDISGVWWCKRLEHFIYTFHMELFFVLSGIVYQCSDYKSFIQKKIKRILVPYIFFGTISILGHAFGGFLVNGVESLEEGIINLLLKGGGYWFLYVSFLLFIIYPFIEKIFDKTWEKVMLIAIVLVLSETVNFPSVFMINKLLYYIPYFVFGNCVKQIIYVGGG